MMPPARGRSYVDARGVLWEVTEHLAQHGDVLALRFSSAEEVRELGLVPDRWADLELKELEELCERAVVVRV